MTALVTSSGSRRLASSTSHTPSGIPRLRSVADRSAKRVLPTPPGPTRVTMRAPLRADLTVLDLATSADEARQLRRQVPPCRRRAAGHRDRLTVGRGVSASPAEGRRVPTTRYRSDHGPAFSSGRSAAACGGEAGTAGAVAMAQTSSDGMRTQDPRMLRTPRRPSTRPPRRALGDAGSVARTFSLRGGRRNSHQASRATGLGSVQPMPAVSARTNIVAGPSIVALKAPT